MKNKRPLAPGFVNKLDDYLLKNKPDTWSARTHLVVYYGLLFIVVLGVLCFIVPDDPRSSSNVYVWGFLTGVMSFIGFIVWLIYLLRFNLFKRFGIISAGDKLKTFILYFISIGIMVGAVYVPTFIEKVRATAAYPDKEVAQDINKMNLAICRLNYDSVQISWDADTVLVRNHVDGATAYYEDGHYTVRKSNLMIIDTADFKVKKMESDSIVKMSDSLYVLYKCPDYNFVNGSFNRFIIAKGKRVKNEILSSFSIYNIVFRKREIFDKTRTEQQLTQLLRKYKMIDRNDSVSSAIDAVSETAFERPYHDYKGHIHSKYKLWLVNMSLANIDYRKYGWGSYAPRLYTRIFYYTTLTLVLLVFIFRHSTLKTFFLSIVSGILLLMLTSLFMAFVGKNLSTLMTCYLLYIIAFFVMAITINYCRTRNIVAGIGLNLFAFFIVFVPLIATVLYYELLKDADRLKGDYVFQPNRYPNEEMHYFYAEITGAILLLILIETGLKHFYRKWYALPEA